MLVHLSKKFLAVINTMFLLMGLVVMIASAQAVSTPVASAQAAPADPTVNPCTVNTLWRSNAVTVGVNPTDPSTYTIREYADNGADTGRTFTTSGESGPGFNIAVSRDNKLLYTIDSLFVVREYSIGTTNFGQKLRTIDYAALSTQVESWKSAGAIPMALSLNPEGKFYMGMKNTTGNIDVSRIYTVNIPAFTGSSTQQAPNDSIVPATGTDPSTALGFSGDFVTASNGDIYALAYETNPSPTSNVTSIMKIAKNTDGTFAPAISQVKESTEIRGMTYLNGKYILADINSHSASFDIINGYPGPLSSNYNLPSTGSDWQTTGLASAQEGGSECSSLDVNISKKGSYVSGPDTSGVYTAVYTIDIINNNSINKSAFGSVIDTPRFNPNISIIDASWVGGYTGTVTGPGPYAITTGLNSLDKSEKKSISMKIRYSMPRPNSLSTCNGPRTGLFNEVNYVNGQSDGTPIDNTTCLEIPRYYDVSITKSVQDASGDGIFSVGESLRYTILVKNTGNSTLTNTVVTDPMFPALNCSSPSGSALGPNITIICTANLIANAQNVANKRIMNTATIKSDQISARQSNTVRIYSSSVPGVSVNKVASVPTGKSVEVGEPISYTITVTNTGTVDLDDIKIADPLIKNLNCTIPSPLIPFDSISCTGYYIATDADLQKGTVDNTVSVTTAQTGAEVFTSSASVKVIPASPIVNNTACVIDTMWRNHIVNPSTATKPSSDYTYIEYDSFGNRTGRSFPSQGEVGASFDMAVSSDGKFLFTIDSAGILRQYSLYDNSLGSKLREMDTKINPIIKDIISRNALPSSLSLSGNDTLYMGFASGGSSMQSVLFEITVPPISNLSASLNTGDIVPISPGSSVTRMGFRGDFVTLPNGSVLGLAFSTESISGRGDTKFVIFDKLPNGKFAAPRDVGYPSGKRSYLGAAFVNGRIMLDTDNPYSTPHSWEYLSEIPNGTVTTAYTPYYLGLNEPWFSNGASSVQEGNGICSSEQIDLAKTPVDVTGPDADGNYTANYSIEVTNSSTMVNQGSYGPLSDNPQFSPNIDVVSASWDGKSTGSKNGPGPYDLTTENTSITVGSPQTYNVHVVFKIRPETASVPCNGPGTGLFNKARFAADDDSNPDNNTACIQPPAPAKMSLTKKVTDESGDGIFSENEQLTYTMIARNIGNVPLTGVKITDPMLTSLVCTPDQPADLQLGEELTCVGKHIATHAEVLSGKLNNTASVVSDQSTPVTATVVIDPNPQPNITIDKVVTDDNKDGIGQLGETLNYTVTVKNTGTTTLNNVTVTDPMLTDMVCTPTSPVTLTPDQTMTCTGAHVVTRDDVMAHTISNTATVSTDLTTPKSDTVVIPTQDLPEMVTTKSVVDASGNGKAEEGETLTYTIQVKNTGNVPLTGVTVSDPKVSGLTCNPVVPVTVPVGGTITCTGTHMVTRADVIAGKVDNTATVSSDQTPTQTPTVSIPTVKTPKMDVVKTVKDASGNNKAEVGEILTYTITVTNSGTDVLTGVQVTDPMLGALICTPTTPVTMVPGDVVTCTGTHTVTKDDVIGGAITNTATAISDQTPQTEGTVTIPGNQTPGVDIVKKVSDASNDGKAQEGEILTYTVTVTNTGTMTLTGVKVTDPMLTDMTCTPASPSVIAPNDVMTCTGTHKVTRDEVISGRVRNTASVNSAETTTPKDTTITIPTDQTSSMDVVKTVKDASGDGKVQTGELLTYTVKVTNTGTAALTGVKVSDPMLSDLTCIPAEPGTLVPGAVMTCTGTHIATRTEVMSSNLANTATAISDQTPPKDGTVTIPTDQSPSIKTSKSVKDASGDGKASEGELLTYTITVENTGETDIHNVKVSDPMLTGINCTPAQPGTLAPDKVMTCTGTHVVTRADVIGGTLINTATVTSDETHSQTPSVDITTAPKDGLTVTKTAKDASGDNKVQVGEVITYTIIAKNTGTSVLHGVKVDDSMLGVLDCTPAQSSTLLPDQVMTCTGTHTATRAEVISGALNNKAIASADNVPPVSDTVTLPADQTPKMIIDNKVTDASGNGIAELGEKLTYTITVTNTGTMTLTDVTVNDPKLSDLTCIPQIPGTLAPDVKMVCTSTVIVDEHTATGGMVFNTATATSVEAPQVSDPADIPASHGIQVAKKLMSTSVVTGEDVQYQITIHNPGAAEAKNVVITDNAVSGLTGAVFTNPTIGIANGTTWTIPVLAPNATETATVTAKVGTGTARNEMTVSADGLPVPTGTPIQPNNGDVTIDTDQRDVVTTPITGPALGIGKKADSDITTKIVGEKVTYTVTVVNTGTSVAKSVKVTDIPVSGLSNVSLSNASIGTINGMDWTVGDILAGKSATMKVTGTLTGGNAVNQVETSGINLPIPTTPIQPNSGDPNTDTDQRDVTVPQAPQNATGGIQVGKKADVTSASTGDTITYTVIVRNPGNSTVTGVKVTDLPDSGLTDVVLSDPSVGTINNTTWMVGDLDAGQTATMKVTGKVSDTGSISNTISGSADNHPTPTDTPVQPNNGDPSTDTDQRDISTVERKTANVKVDKKLVTDLSTTKTGDKVTYEIVVKNAGEAPSGAITVTDDVLGGLKDVVFTDPSTGAVNGTTWTLDALSPGQAEKVTVTAVFTGGTAKNSVTSSGEGVPVVTGDIQPNDDVDSDTDGRDVVTGTPGETTNVTSTPPTTTPISTPISTTPTTPTTPTTQTPTLSTTPTTPRSTTSPVPPTPTISSPHGVTPNTPSDPTTSVKKTPTPDITTTPGKSITKTGPTVDTGGEVEKSFWDLITGLFT